MSKLARTFRLPALAFTGFACAWAQTARTGVITGSVTDSAGALVPGASVSVVEKSTQFVSKTSTNAEGRYYLPYLAVGTYDLTVQAQGFKKSIRADIQVRAAEVPRVDVVLELGAVSESVTVTGGAPLIETETSLVSQTIEAQALEKIPILQIKAHRILYYMVGVQSRGANSSVVGQSSNQLGFTLDGISAKESIRGPIGDTNTTVQPVIDALAEAKVYTTGAPADVGHAAGGMISYTFKSGTNELHGSLEDRYIGKSMIHRHVLEELRRTNPFSDHQIQSMISGPVYLPKLYNGRNRSFFLFAFGQHRNDQDTPQSATVPDANMLRGDFSFPQAPGGGFPIYDPRTIRQVGNTWTADPFPSNRIPEDRFDTVARNFLALDPWKAANNPNGTVYTRTGPSNNWTGYTLYRGRRTRYDAKFDHQISANHKMFVRTSQNPHRQTGFISGFLNNLELDAAAFSFGRPNPIHQQNWAFADYYTLSPSLVNEVRLGYNRRRSEINPPTANQGWAEKLGIPNVGGENFPGFGIFGIGPGGYSRSISEDFTFQNNVTKVAGRSTFKFGYEMIRTRENNVETSLPSGNYGFSTAGTALPFTPNTGNQFASFLLGAVDSATFTQQRFTWLPRWRTHSGFIQGDLKLRRTLTINIGVRYTYETPFQTKYGQKSQFDPTAIDPLTGRQGAIIHPAGTVYRSDRNNFQPRVGMAWNFHPRMVFRGSWGLFTQDMLADGGFQEYAATAVLQQLAGDPRPAFFLSSGPPPRNFNFNADGTVPFVGTNFAGRTATFVDPGLRVPYVMNWSGGLQFDLGRQWVHELIYQGSAGIGMTDSVNVNELPESIYSSTNTPFKDQVSRAVQNYRPYQNFGNINMLSNFGHSTYHGFVARIEKRYSDNGLTFNAHWTWSKNLSGTAGTGWQYYNWGLTKSRTGFDTRHRIIMMAMYELPFGKGRKFVNSGWMNHVFGGWELDMIYTILSGPPLTFTFAGSPHRYLPGPARPHQIVPDDQVPIENWEIGPHRFPQSAQNPVFKMQSFAYPDALTVGTLGAGTQSGLWQVWPQWSIFKTWSLRDRARFTLGLDGNNIPVRMQFTNPNVSLNFTNPQNFGRFAPGGTNFSTLGTPNGHVILRGRVEF